MCSPGERKESIVIADRITVKVVSIRGNRVRLAIEAPKEVRVLRTELVDVTVEKTVAA